MAVSGLLRLTPAARTGVLVAGLARGAAPPVPAAWVEAQVQEARRLHQQGYEQAFAEALRLERQALALRRRLPAAVAPFPGAGGQPAPVCW